MVEKIWHIQAIFFSIGYKIRVTNWNQRALLDWYAFRHIAVLFLDRGNFALKCGFPLAGTRRIAPRKIAPGKLPNPNSNPNPPRQFWWRKSSRGSILRAISRGRGFSCHTVGHHHVENVCVLWERESSSDQNHKRGQVKGRRREGECGRRIARKIRVLTRENFAICVHH